MRGSFFKISRSMLFSTGISFLFGSTAYAQCMAPMMGCPIVPHDAFHDYAGPQKPGNVRTVGICFANTPPSASIENDLVKLKDQMLNCLALQQAICEEGNGTFAADPDLSFNLSCKSVLADVIKKMSYCTGNVSYICDYPILTAPGDIAKSDIERYFRDLTPPPATLLPPPTPLDE